MTLREHIQRELGHNVFHKIEEDRKAEQNGVPGRRVTLHTGRIYHEFFFADANKMTNEHIVKVIASYLRNPREGSEYLVE